MHANELDQEQNTQKVLQKSFHLGNDYQKRSVMYIVNTFTKKKMREHAHRETENIYTNSHL